MTLIHSAIGLRCRNEQEKYKSYDHRTKAAKQEKSARIQAAITEQTRICIAFLFDDKNPAHLAPLVMA